MPEEKMIQSPEYDEFRMKLNEESGYIAGSSAEKTYRNKMKGEYTVSDYEALPEERRVELIDGVFYDMAAPSYLHQTILAELYTALSDAIRKKGGPCRVVLSPCDVRLDEDDKTMVQPDLFILCDKEKHMDGKRIKGAPDFIAEIVSPSSRSQDMFRKFRKYDAAGVREYWIVDPENRSVITYHFVGEGGAEQYHFDDVIPVNIYGGDIHVDFAEIKKVLVEVFGEDFGQ